MKTSDGYAGDDLLSLIDDDLLDRYIEGTLPQWEAEEIAHEWGVSTATLRKALDQADDLAGQVYIEERDHRAACRQHGA